ncbi:MAG: class I SAM-dependent methyltransferase [Phycisphaerales bacterium]|nr:MAG: class I SAM-dependent methyltransferase [Phycisphaerales bacterium]
MLSNVARQSQWVQCVADVSHAEPSTRHVLRTRKQKIKDFLTFPLRAVALFEFDRWGLTSLRSERFDYAAPEVRGHCLDVGCGRHDLFIAKYCRRHGKGIDVYPYEGLTEAHLVEDITHFPFDDASFDTVTFIASINHVPRSKRDIELAEAYRCLRDGGNIVLTMGKPVAELAAHLAIYTYDKLFGTNHDVDMERGMEDGETYFVTEREIRRRLTSAGFVDIGRKLFWTQWGLNRLYIGWKPQLSARARLPVGHLPPLDSRLREAPVMAALGS